MKSAFQCLPLAVGLASVLSSVAVADVTTEDFSGSGPYTVSGGPSGFDADGWSLVGTSGSFFTNGFGETVYGVSSNAGSNPFAQDGLVRTVGDIDFDALFEFSNPSFGSSGTVTLGMADFTAGAGIQLVYQESGSTSSVNMFVNDGSGFEILGSAAFTGIADRTTLYLDFRSELSPGGNLFEAYVEFDESGILQQIGTIGTADYGLSATSSRTLFVSTAAFQGGGTTTAQFDRFEVTAVPEPSSAWIVAAAACGFGVRRRRQGITVAHRRRLRT